VDVNLARDYRVELRIKEFIHPGAIMQDIFRNILLGITLAAPIGPAGVAVIQSGLRGGFPRAFLTGIGITMADTTYLLVVFFGLASFISYPAVKISIWALGAVLLVYLGVQSIRESGRKIDFDIQSTQAPRNPLAVGYMVNISNPMAVVFWLGIYGSLLGATTQDGNQTNALLQGAAILVGILMWHSTVSFLTHWGKRLLNETSTKYISIIAGVVLILFGLRFAVNAVSTLLG
jgi:threonine/homoserine/homoserine lactone efflux protein